MDFRLPRLPKVVGLVDKVGAATQTFTTWWQSVVTQIEQQIGSQDELLAQIAVVQDGLTAAVAELTTTQAALATAQADIIAAQEAAEAAQAAADAIVVPPSGGRTITANDTLLDSEAYILADATAGNITLTIPSAATERPAFTVTKTDASANTVTVDPVGTNTINGSPTLILTAQYQSATLYNNGIDAWYT